MVDFVTKIRILIMLLHSTFDEWKNQIWNNDLDTPYCCSGRDCGCGGMTYREIYSPENQIVEVKE